jgi:hypothetical protein
MSVLAPQKTDTGWIIRLPDDFTDMAGVAKDSIGVLQVTDGKIEIEILPPPSPRIKEISALLAEKYKDVLAELKRLGD